MASNNNRRRALLVITMAAAAMVIVPTTLVNTGTLVNNDDRPEEVAATNTTAPEAELAAQTTTSAQPAQNCAGSGRFFAREATGNRFGPEAPTEVEAAKADFAARRAVDCMNLVANAEYQFDEYTDPATRVQKTIDLIADPAAQAALLDRFTADLDAAQTTEIVEMHDKYQTFYAVTEGRMIPEVYQDVVDRPTYLVLRFTWADGRVKNYKLDCGFQPVEQNFPKAIPGTAPQPSPKNPPPPAKVTTTTTPGSTTTTPVVVTTTTTPVVPKCPNGNPFPYCGTPDSGPELGPVQSNPQPSTPGYQAPSPSNPSIGGNPGTGSGGATPNDGNGDAGTNDPEPSEGSGQNNNGSVSPPP